MTLNQFSDVALPIAAGALLVYSVRQLATARDRYWPFRIAAVLSALAVTALVSAATFLLNSYSFQVAMSRLAEGFGIATLVVLAAAAVTGRIPDRRSA